MTRPNTPSPSNKSKKNKVLPIGNKEYEKWALQCNRILGIRRRPTPNEK